MKNLYFLANELSSLASNDDNFEQLQEID